MLLTPLTTLQAIVLSGGVTRYKVLGKPPSVVSSIFYVCSFNVFMTAYVRTLDPLVYLMYLMLASLLSCNTLKPYTAADKSSLPGSANIVVVAWGAFFILSGVWGACGIFAALWCSAHWNPTLPVNSLAVVFWPAAAIHYSSSD